MKYKINKLWFSLKPGTRAILIMFSGSIAILLIILIAFISPAYYVKIFACILWCLIAIAVIYFVYRQIKECQELDKQFQEFENWVEKLRNRN